MRGFIGIILVCLSSFVYSYALHILSKFVWGPTYFFHAILPIFAWIIISIVLLMTGIFIKGNLRLLWIPYVVNAIMACFAILLRLHYHQILIALLLLVPAIILYKKEREEL